MAQFTALQTAQTTQGDIATLQASQLIGATVSVLPTGTSQAAPYVTAAVGVLNSVVSLFYYARLLRTMYFSKAGELEHVTIRPVYGIATLTLVVPTLVLGLYWGPVYDFVARSMVLAR